jgi:hypothetical protein
MRSGRRRRLRDMNADETHSMSAATERPSGFSDRIA